MSLSGSFKLLSSLVFHLNIKRLTEIQICLPRSLAYCNVEKNESGKNVSSYEEKYLGHFVKCFPELKQIHRS